MASNLTLYLQMIRRSPRMVIAAVLLLLVSTSAAYLVGRASVTSRATTAATDQGDSVDRTQDSALIRAERAKLLFEQHEFDNASDELRAAIRLNPGDAGQGNEAVSAFLSASAVRHGEAQVREMLKDRPAMSQRATPDSFLWKWAVRKFAGEDAGILVDWNPKDPAPFDGNLGGGNGTNIWIQVRKSNAHSAELNCDAEWSRAVCQLFGAAARKEHHALARRALQGELDCEAYTSAMMASEARARHRTRQFYLEHYLPSLRLSNTETSPAAWHCFEFYPDDATQMERWRDMPRWNFHLDWFELLAAAAASSLNDSAKNLKHLESIEAHLPRLTSEQVSAFHQAKARYYEGRGDFLAALNELEVTHQLSPQSPLMAYEYSSALQRAASTGQIATSDLDRLIEKNPKSPFLYGVRARLHFQNKEIDKAIEDVSEAIQLNREDVGNIYELSSSKQLSDEAISHGEKQIREMLRDRPLMAESITAGDELWTWTVRKFAGEDGDLIDWSSASPAPHAARCVPATAAQRAQINIRETPINLVDDRSEEFNRLWAWAVFELHNVTHAGKSSEVTRQAWQGAIDRDTYIATMLEREQFAVQSARAFYLKRFLPLMRTRGANASPDVWHCFTFYPSDAVREQHWKAIGLWDYYRAYYDKLSGLRAQAIRGQRQTPAIQIVTGEDLNHSLYESENGPGGNGALNQLGPSIDSLMLPEPDDKPSSAN